MKELKYTLLSFVLALLTAGISFAQAEKNKLMLGLGYYNENNRIQYLKANTKAKIDGKFTPVGGIQIKFFISSESPENLLGSAKTDGNGQVVFFIPPGAKNEWDKSPKQSFLAVSDSSSQYDAVNTSIDLTKAKIKLDTAEDKKIIATLVEQEASMLSEQPGAWQHSQTTRARAGHLREGPVEVLQTSRINELKLHP